MFYSFYRNYYKVSFRHLINLRKSIIRRTHSAKNDDVPIKFSTSQAYNWKAEYTRRGEQTQNVESVWFEPLIISGSLVSFLLYFCVFREENDIDEALKLSLYDRIDGLEELQLKASLDYNLKHGKDTSNIIARLKEIEQSK